MVNNMAQKATEWTERRCQGCGHPLPPETKQNQLYHETSCRAIAYGAKMQDRMDRKWGRKNHKDQE